MSALLNTQEANDLWNYINDNLNPRKNMHTREVRRARAGQPRRRKYLNGMKIVNREVHGHVHFYNGIEVEYIIHRNGGFTISSQLNCNITTAKQIVRDLKDFIMKRVSQGHGGNNIYPRRTTDEYYLMRQGWGLTTTAHQAIQNGDFPFDFLDKMANWNLCLIKGR